MLIRSRPSVARTIALASLSALVLLSTPVAAQDQDLTLRQWSTLVWDAARGGETEQLQSYLRLRPEGFEDPRLARIREGLGQYQVNREAGTTDRSEALAGALEELRTELAEGGLSQALRAAVHYQTLSPDLDEALKTSEVQDVILQARLGIPQAEADRDWLYAQELLFRLRTLYDDTNERALYNKYDKQLKEINRRVSMLQQYAPERVYELRNQLALRLGQEPLPEFNPNMVIDWRERVEGVRANMVKVGLRATAYEHIESLGSEGWRPLLRGGLIALETLANTDELAETFPGISEPAAVQKFSDYIDSQLRSLAQTPDAALQYRHLEQVLDGLESINEQTILLPEGVLFREFGDGAMFELSTAKEDNYSDIIWPDEIRRFRQQTEGNFVGVGILIRHNERREIVVVNPLEGTPAFRAGIRPGDIIAQVNGTTTAGWSLPDAVDRITGRSGSEVVLRIEREGAEGRDVPLTRTMISLRSVMGWYKKELDQHGDPVWDWMIDPENRIGYARLTSFSESTYDELMDAWGEMQKNGVRGLILDLRHNPGGLLDQAWSISNLFIPAGRVVSIEGKRPDDIEVLSAHRNRARIAASGIPVVVLVNKGSASASEIVSGAVQAHQAAVILGTRTWGKGSVQRVFGIAPNAQLKLTTQYYRLPAGPDESEGRLVHKRPGASEWGVDPDVEVEMTPEQIIAAINFRDAVDTITSDQAEDERPDVNDLITTGIDPQLETALLILQARSAGSLGEGHARLH